jgi:hypothetical protein
MADKVLGLHPDHDIFAPVPKTMFDAARDKGRYE